VLTCAAAASSVLNEMLAMESDAIWQIRCATVMPDHAHLLFVLGERLSLGKSLARLKGKTAGALRSSSPSATWERDFFDRMIRQRDEILPVFLYVFLNPYRAGLSDRAERWPWFYCAPADWGWFQSYLDEDRPLPEWLGR
jgi:REP element-mobilizing transposase RayT